MFDWSHFEAPEFKFPLISVQIIDTAFLQIIIGINKFNRIFLQITGAFSTSFSEESVSLSFLGSVKFQ